MESFSVNLEQGVILVDYDLTLHVLMQGAVAMKCAGDIKVFYFSNFTMTGWSIASVRKNIFCRDCISKMT
jgi:hypothetical protein